MFRDALLIALNFINLTIFYMKGSHFSFWTVQKRVYPLRA